MQFDTKTPRHDITIQGHAFSVIAPYSEGHALTANEAAVLNQTLAENIRNNFAGVVVKAAKENKDLASLQGDLEKYMEEYSFGVRRTGFVVGDPVEREARKIALEKAKELLKKKGLKIAEVAKETMAELIEKILDKKPEIRQIAKEIVANRQSVANAALDIEV